MKYIPEYHMRSGVPVGGGERVTGYYIDRISVDGKKSEPIIFNDSKHPNGWYSVEVDPETLEPIRVKPIRIGRQAFQCPQCNMIMNPFGQATNFCHHCGMALDWSKNDDE